MSFRLATALQPCLPSSDAAPPVGPDWLHEIKRAGDRVRLYTRGGYDWRDRFTLIAEAVASLSVRSCLIDGEVIVCGDSGLAEFDLLRGRQHDGEAVLCAFDLMELDGRDLRHEPIEQRKAELADLLAGGARGLVLNRVYSEPGDAVYKCACALGCEGVVSKRRGSRYVAGRTDVWRKCKNPKAPAVRREAVEQWGERRWR
jgi:bifunctional non-homologous end joining protein LigD